MAIVITRHKARGMLRNVIVSPLKPVAIRQCQKISQSPKLRGPNSCQSPVAIALIY